MTMLDRKLLRDLWALKSQALTIALVVMAGLGAFIAQLSTYDSLQWLRQAYYDTSRFAHIFVDVKRAPKAVERQLADLPGVADVETTVVFDVTLDLADVAEPVIGRMIGLDATREPQLNRLFLRQGRLLVAGRRNEALVSEAFARARQLQPGDRLAAVLNGKREVLEIVGIVLSPEYIFSSRGGAIPDEKSFGVFWMDRQYLATAFDMEGAFTHAVLRLAPNASEPGIIDALDRLLDVYGSLGAYGRDEQMSHRILSQEIAQQKTMATVFPSIFLGVAVFLLHMVLSRQVATQREQIAALKALGYANVTIAMHYLKLVGVIVMLGHWTGSRARRLARLCHDGHVCRVLPFPALCLSFTAVDSPHRRWREPARRSDWGTQYRAPGGAARPSRSHAPACPTPLSAHAPRTSMDLSTGSPPRPACSCARWNDARCARRARHVVSPALWRFLCPGRSGAMRWSISSPCNSMRWNAPM